MTPPGGDPTKFELRITEGDDEAETWAYECRRIPQEGLTLVFDPAHQAFRLEKRAEQIECNLISTPWESDTVVLRARYPYLEDGNGKEGDADAESSTGEHDPDSPIDENNPYDVRRWMRGDFDWFFEKHDAKSAKGSPSSEGEGQARLVGEYPNKSTERDDADDESSQDSSRQTRKPKTAGRKGVGKRKPKGRKGPRPAARPELPGSARDPQSRHDDLVIELGSESPYEHTTGLPLSGHITNTHQRQPNEVSKKKDESSDNGLIIEIEAETKPKRGLGAGLNRMVSGGPISLRSAASSLSPARSRTSSSGEGDPITSPRHTPVERQRHHADVDVDVVEELPLPIASERDEEDELEAELAHALESEDYPAQQIPSESESEEE